MAKFTQAQMEQAFDNVKNKKHWKNPIAITIDNPGKKNLECLEEAIIHFTGSGPIITERGDKIRVEADGYYASEAMCFY